MQDVQNIPNPDVNSTNDDFDSHSDFPNTDVGQPTNIPLPPDAERNVPVEEPPESDKPEIREDRIEPDELV